MPQPIRGQGGHLVFPIGPKNTNLVEDVEIYLPVKFCQIPFSGFRGEVEKCEKLTATDGRTKDGRTEDGQCMITIVHLSLRLRCTKKENAHQKIDYHIDFEKQYYRHVDYLPHGHVPLILKMRIRLILHYLSIFNSKFCNMYRVSDWQCMYFLPHIMRNQHELPFPDPALGLLAKCCP